MKKIILSLMCVILHIVASRAEGGMRLLTTSFKHPELAKWAAENPVVLENFTRQDFVGLPNFNDYDDVKNAADSLANAHGFIVLEHTRPVFWESALHKDSLYALEIDNKVRKGYNFQGGYLVFEYSYEDGILPKLRILFRHFQATQKVNPEELKKEQIINLTLNEIYQDAMLNFPKIEETRRMNYVQRSLLNLEKVDKYYFTMIDDKPQPIKERKAKAYYFTDRGNFIGEGKEAEAGIYFYGEEWFKVCFPQSLTGNLTYDNYYRKDRFVRFSIMEKESNHLRDLYSESCKIVDVFDSHPAFNKWTKAMTERWGMCYVENRKLVFQEIDKSFRNYSVSPTINHEYDYQRVKSANGIDNLSYYSDNNHTYIATWHTHPYFRSQQALGTCENKYGFGYPSGDGTCSTWGGSDVQSQDKIADQADFRKIWQLRGGLGIIPSSKGITIFRHHGISYKEFIVKPQYCEDNPIIYSGKYYCKWKYYFENGFEENMSYPDKKIKIELGGFHIIAYDFTYKISSLK
jgi:hypothetical protein